MIQDENCSKGNMSPDKKKTPKLELFLSTLDSRMNDLHHFIDILDGINDRISNQDSVGGIESEKKPILSDYNMKMDDVEERLGYALKRLESNIILLEDSI